MRIVGNNPQLSRQTQGTASGAITGGKPVLVNTDGTVTQISETAASVGSEAVFVSAEVRYVNATFDSNSNRVVIAYRNDASSDNGFAVVGSISGTSITYGTPVTFNSASSDDIAMTFDSNSNKVVIVYQDGGNSSYGTAIVGTVDSSDNSISFGSEVVFNSANASDLGITFDSSNNKVVVGYKDNGSSSAKAKVGTVSGTGISFGSEATFDSSDVDDLGMTFDSNSNKVVIGYVDNGNSSYGTGIVGTVSGTSISFGTATVFESATVSAVSASFDSNSNKVVFGYRDGGNSEAGTAVVGTVSSTSISFGTPVVFNSGATNYTHESTFDSSTNKVIIAYQDGGNSNKGTVIEGTVSGTSISFSSETVFNNATTTQHIAPVYDTNANKTAIAFRDDGNSNYGTAVVYSSLSSNITSENFIGFAEDTVATGQPVTVNTKGTVDENQSSLTPGQQYFVQTDGTLGTSAGSPSVVAGTAVTATKLIVKG